MKSNAFLNLVVVIVLVVIGYWAVTGTDLFKNLSLNEQSLVGAPAAVSTAVLGTNSIGSILDDGSVNAINASPYTMPAEGGKAVSISVYIENIEAGSQFGLAIYDDLSGKPGKLVASTPAQTLDGSVTAGWKTVPITADLKANTKYWLAYNATAVGTKKNLLRYVPATPGSNVWKFIGLGVWPSDYSTAPGSTGEGSSLVSIYVTYEKPVVVTTSSSSSGGSSSYTPVAPNTNFAVGSRITVSQGPINVRSSTSRSSNNIIGTQPTGALGNIIQGPVNQAGFTWWKVDYDTGVDGWTTGAYQYVIGVLNTTSSSSGSSSSSGGTPTQIPFSFRLFDGSNKTIVQGASATSSVTVQKIAGTAEAVNFSVSGLPTGVGGTFSPTSCTPNTSCSSVLTLTAQTSASIGTRTVTITGSSNSTSTNTSFALTIDSAPIIVVSTSTPSSNDKYVIGSVIRVTGDNVNIRNAPGLTGTTILGQQSTGALGTVIDGPVVASGFIWWKFDFSSGVDGWSIQNYNEEVSRPGTTAFNFDLVYNGAGVSVGPGTQDQTEYSFTSSLLSGSPQLVTLTSSNLPAGVTIRFNNSCPFTSSNTCNVPFYVSASSSAVPGSYNITVTASGGGVTKNVQVPLVVRSPLSYTLTTQGAKTAAAGSSFSNIVTVNRNSAPSKQVEIASTGSPAGVTLQSGSRRCAPSGGTCTVTLAYNVSVSTVPGTYTVTLKAYEVDNFDTTTTVVAGVTTFPLTITEATVSNSSTFNTGDEVEVIPGTGTLNVRSGPGTSYGIIGTKTDGATGFVQADANNGVFANTYNWWKVDFGGLVGWSVEAFLRLFQSGTPQPTGEDNVPNLGINLYFPYESDRSEMFADVIRSSRGFEASGLDANHWPTSDFNNYVFSDNSEHEFGAHKMDVSGTFTLAFNGKGDISVGYGSVSCPPGKTCSTTYNGGRAYYDAAKNLTVASINFSPVQDFFQAYRLSVRNTQRTATSPTNSGVTNVRLIRPGYVSTDGNYTTTQTFTNQFLTAIEPFKVIRLMDYMLTNWFYGTTDTERRTAALGSNGRLDWSERPNPNERSWSGVFGAPIEWMVELANTADKDLWINIPHMASDEYINSLALYLKNGQTVEGVYYPPLEADRKVYLEWSNEVWNRGMFKQGEDNDNWAAAAGICTRCYTAKRTIEVSNIFRTVFGNDAMMTKIRPIIADQYAWRGRLAESLNWVYRTYSQMPNHYFYGLAIAPYFGPANAETTATVDQMMSGPGSFYNAINGRLRSVMELVDGSAGYNDFYSIAQSYGLKYIAYEGGIDTGYSGVSRSYVPGVGTVITSTPPHNNIANRIAVSYDQRMKNVIAGYFGQWNGCGGDLFMYFNFAGALGTFQWALTDDVGSSAANQPKLEGAKFVSNTDRRYFECAPLALDGSFFGYNPNGSVGTGSGLTGTYYSDTNFTNIATTKDGRQVVRIDPLINFIWLHYGVGHPYPLPNPDGRTLNFSVRWTGKIQPKFTGTYTFTLETDTDDQSTLWINGQNLAKGGTINLTAGQKYDVKIEAKMGGNMAGKVRLWWELPGQQVKAIVPKSQLYPN